MRVITGTARGTKLLTPEGLHTRPTTDRVKEGLFSAIQFEIEGARVLDLFSGTGQLGIEALSRGAAYAVFTDNDEKAVRLVKENLKRAKLLDRAAVIRTDYLSYLRTTKERFDLIFLDPPYKENFLEIAIRAISEIDILRNRGIIICEKTADRALANDFAGLTRIKEYRYGTTSVVLYRKETV